MNVLWPQNLWLMLALPLLPALYLWLLRRPGKQALRLSHLSVVRHAGSRPRRRHVPPAMFMLAMSLLLLGLARPTARMTLPWTRTTVMLAIDVSLSCA
jgi:Ca-activated chloride channel family protein